jgi:hypothetical protein
MEAVLAQNVYPPAAVAAVHALMAELRQTRPVRTLVSSQPDQAQWNARLAACPNRGWLDLPFYFAEAFFYRRLLEAIHYFDPGPWQGIDPFQAAKDDQLHKDIRPFEDSLEGLWDLPDDERCEAFLYCCLWGNQVDLSNSTTVFWLPTSQDRLIVNHASFFTRRLSQGVKNLAYILDNVGIELYFDLGWIDFLLATGRVERVTVHLKNVPFFISDTMPKDLLGSIRLLKGSSRQQAVQAARRLEGALAGGTLRLEASPFWTSGLTYREAPLEFTQALGGADLAVFKGDLNYRRLLGDLHWDPATPLEAILDYIPSPVAVLRTLKSQLVAGLAAGQAAQLNRLDPNWLINSEHGIIQYIQK